MLIPLTRPSSSSPPLPPPLVKLGTQLFLLELQGSLEVTGTPELGEGAVGQLRMGEKPTLQIGHHLLEGKVVTLPKPLAVLRKRASRPHSTEPEPQPEPEPMKTEDEDEAIESPTAGGTTYEILEIVRLKLFFARRPALVVSKPGAGAGGGK
ncbi:hypothetical protein DACRYDRAFT_13957 [Dacryopinax primogenitus]|uniref:Ctf8-domain-containing protein n=1 Tax=Dacryopinax primogenitus (strain DJM 731) TaxID=1858805 RepID=M5GDT7_DACPD|nr:uncharacterized protein DACRYDRAFT_13957 [Dacryopinax primogenitus]EJU04822.1 hypothetical protein DACRYDRAFT_13957 [Dacryopinax primogenitus]